MITLNDRFICGLISGILAGLAENSITITSYHFGIINTRWMDWASLFVFSTRPINLIETILSFILQLAFSSLLGIIFAYLIIYINTKNLPIKALAFGLLSWFSLYTIVHLYKIEDLMWPQSINVLIDMIGVVVWSIVLAYAINFFNKRYTWS